MTISIYTLSNPETDKIYYVGQTDDPDRRFYEHWHKPGRIDGNSFLSEWLLQLFEYELVPKMNVIKVCYSSYEANEFERQMIQKLWNEGHPILNIKGSFAKLYQIKERLLMG